MKSRAPVVLNTKAQDQSSIYRLKVANLACLTGLHPIILNFKQQNYYAILAIYSLALSFLNVSMISAISAALVSLVPEKRKMATARK